MIFTEILIVAILILINAFFAMSEIAIVSSSKPLLRHLSKQGDGRADVALKLGEKSSHFLSTVQVGIVLCSILAGYYGGSTLAIRIAPTIDSIPLLHGYGESISVALIVSCITYLSVVIGELLPKKIGINYAEKIALAVAKPMSFLTNATYPVVVVLSASAHIFMKIFGLLAEKDVSAREEEFKAVLSDGAHTGVIEKTEHEMLQRVIRLDDRDVKSIMTHRTDVIFIRTDDTVEEIKEKIHESGHSRYPVLVEDTDELKGIVQAKDLLDSALYGNALDIAKHMKDVMILPESASCLQALESFKRHHINLIVIVDEYGSTQGIVTSSDILEAIVGILPSNYDADDQLKITQRGDGSWLVDGRTPIEEIHLSIGLHEISADEDFDTIAGFLLDVIRKSPAVGLTHEAFGHKFEIVDMDGHRIDKLLITKIIS